MSTLVTLLAITGPARAAVPSNDDIVAATPVQIGFEEVLNTSGATDDDQTQDLNDSCGFDETEASVWYSFEADVAVDVAIDVGGSDYAVGIAVGTGSIDDPSGLECGIGGSLTVFQAEPERLYYVSVFDYEPYLDETPPGGLLQIRFDAAPPRPVLDVFTVDKHAGVGPNRLITVTGTYVCRHAVSFRFQAQMTQRGVVYPLFFSLSGQLTCDGTAHRWVVVENRTRPRLRFHVGPALLQFGDLLIQGEFQVYEPGNFQLQRLRLLPREALSNV